MIRLFIFPLFFLATLFVPLTASAAKFDRICHQQWCYTGDKGNSITSSVLPTSGEDSLEMGVYIFKSKIEFWEMPFKAGRYHIKANVVSNQYGTMVVEEVINSSAVYLDGIVIVGLKSGLAKKLKAGRFFKVRIYHNDQLAYSATYPLYGFSKAYNHLH